MAEDSQREDLPKVLYDALLSDKTAAADKQMLRRLALAYIDEPQSWLRCKNVLKEFKVLKDIEKRVVLLARELQQIPSIGGDPVIERSIADVWHDAPCGPDVYPPSNYQISPGLPAIERVEKKVSGDVPYEKRVEVSVQPMVITQRIGHVQSNSLLFEVQFKTHFGWRKIRADRSTFFTARKIVEHASMGLSVGSDNAVEVVAWLRQYEAANGKLIPLGYVSSAMGWQGENDHPTHHGFLCGKRQIGGNGKAIELEGGPGDMFEAEQIRTRGSFEQWNAAVKSLTQFPAIRLGIFASLAAPLIAVLDTSNAIVEWAGRTSRGKSTVLQVAQSCWRSAGTRMATWNSTIMGVEAAAQFLSDLPLIIDDTSAAVDGGRSQSLAKVIYQLMSGRARGRATQDGTQKARGTWRTVVISSGEAPLGELAKAEGASARVLTFWSNPLGKISKETGTLAEQAIHDLSENYGHAGPRVVEWLCQNRDRWDHLRHLHRITSERIREKIPTPASARLAPVVALLSCAAYVGFHSGATPWATPILDDDLIVESLYDAMDLASASADRAYQAWEYVTSLAESQSRRWGKWDRDLDPDKEPHGGWLGVASATEWGFYPAHLKQLLAGGQFHPDTILRAWKDAGALGTPTDGYVTQCRPYGDRTKARLIIVSREYPGRENELGDD